jgi:hypothetical protein
LKTNEQARTEAQLHRRRTEQSDGPEKLYCKRSHGQALIISERPVGEVATLQESISEAVIEDSIKKF